MSNSMFVQAMAQPRRRASEQRLAFAPRRLEGARNLLALLVEAFLEARAMTQQVNRRFPFGGE